MTWRPTITEHTLLRHIISVNGERHQEVKAAEEYAEAAAAISRLSNGYGSLDETAGELADADIMREQLFTIHPELREKIALKRAEKMKEIAIRFAFPETS